MPTLPARLWHFPLLILPLFLLSCKEQPRHQEAASKPTTERADTELEMLKAEMAAEGIVIPDASELARQRETMFVEHVPLTAWCCLGEYTNNPIPLYSMGNQIISLQKNQPVGLFTPAGNGRIKRMYGTADGKQVIFDRWETDWETISYVASVLDISYDGGKPVAKHREIFRKSLPYTSENRDTIDQFGSRLFDEGYLYVEESVWGEKGYPSTVHRINVTTGAVDVLAGLSEEIKKKIAAMDMEDRELRRCLHYVKDGVYRMEPVRSGPKFISTLDRLMKDGKPVSPAQWWLPLPITSETSQGPTTQPGR